MQARAKWALKRIVIAHKLGACPVGETSVLIAASSEHRSESLHAVEFIINLLKETVPIWKKELYAAAISQDCNHPATESGQLAQQGAEGDCVWKQNKEFNMAYKG
jgi:molybdopterin synthase catalytic subunit